MPAQIHQLETNEDTAFLREALRILVQSFIEVEVSAFIDANPYERSDSRRTHRNGYRQRSWRTSLGEMTLFIPKLRKGTYYPAFLDSLRQSEPAFLELAQEASERDVSSRDIEHLAHRLGLSPLHRSQLAEIEERLHDLVQRHQFHQNNVPISLLFMDDGSNWLGKGQPHAHLWDLNILAIAA